MRKIAFAAALAAFAAWSALAEDAAEGRAVFETRCIGCHSLAANRVGPALGTVFGRKAGAHPGFDYSPALKAAGHIWDAETLERWLADPQAFVPGAAMPFRLGSAEERRCVVAFLHGLER